ncbi:hypothetical protein HPB51_009464 [Rhipicephalus microplus]|uniref:Uncharacterized protein n=1 Tax=Rhipicephalus microplus TaxID=6941 RepID=A0A9J6DU40_RHIMP|nr:hypothetical protein HPB51_009464 [Rhipicephalus microplus]
MPSSLFARLTQARQNTPYSCWVDAASECCSRRLTKAWPTTFVSRGAGDVVFPDCPRPSPSRCRVDSSTAARCQQAAKTTWNLGEAQQCVHSGLTESGKVSPGVCVTLAQGRSRCEPDDDSEGGLYGSPPGYAPAPVDCVSRVLELISTPLGTRRQALLLQHTLTSSEAQSPSSSVRTSTSCELRSLGERTPTPSLTRRAQRMSVATEASDSGGSVAPGSASVDYDTRSVPWSAPLGPRPTGSYSSLISLGQRSLGAHRPSPRSLQVSPALAQRSLYAQHVLNSPEVANGRNGGVRCGGGVSGATASATLEFAYIRPDSPVTLTGPRRSTLDSGHCQRSQSSCFGGASPFLQLGEPHHKLLQQQQQQRHHRNHKHHQNHYPAAPPFALHDLRAALPGEDDEPRPSSIYGQPSLTVVGDRAAYSVQPPDVVPNNHAPRPSASKLMKRAVRAYTHSKSDSSFVLKQSPSQLQGHLAVT